MFENAIQRGVVPFVRSEDFYSNVLGITQKELVRRLSHRTEVRMVKRGETLINAGEVQRHMYFLVSGVARGYLLEDGGSDITDYFYYRLGEPIICGMEPRQPSQINVEALTDCKLQCLPMEEIPAMLSSCPQSVKYVVELLLASAQLHWQLKILLYRHTAMERYEWFLENYPGLIDQVKHKHIASFLGMTPVTLSRLRAEVRSRQD